MTTHRTNRARPLSAGERAAFRRDGIVVPRHTLPATELDRLRSALDRSHFDRDLFRPGESTSTYLVDFSRRPIWLVRGADRTGKNDFRTGH